MPDHQRQRRVDGGGIDPRLGDSGEQEGEHGEAADAFVVSAGVEVLGGNRAAILPRARGAASTLESLDQSPTYGELVAEFPVPDATGADGRESASAY